MPYPLNTPLGRFGIETLEEGPARCVATVPVHGMLNPLTGAPTISTLALLVDHIGGLINHRHRQPHEWTVTSELSLEVCPDAVDVVTRAPATPVTGVSLPLGRNAASALGQCELRSGDDLIATATVRSFYISAPAELTSWPDSPQATLPGPTLRELMALDVAETGGAATILTQRDDPALNNSVGAVHGGISSMGLELAGSAELNRNADGAPYRTASLRVNFLRPFHGGPAAHYHATQAHLGRSSGVAETRAVGSDGRVAMLGRLTAYRAATAPSAG
ncbi:MAG: hotdog fold thioesterase [Actinomycetota bacterium]|nr:hotdog fold thioesterase [Actinomycetota bacterium]